MLSGTLVEDYRPRSFSEVVGNDWVKEILERMIKNDTPQNMIFVGRPGCGKTTMARIFASKYLGDPVDFSVDASDYREVNASDKRGIDVVRSDYISGFCKRRGNTPNKKRILYVDEFDLTREAQRALRSLMENYQDRVIIIIALNEISRIKEEALLSRCVVFKFDPQPPEKLGKYFLKIANAEGIKFESEDLINDILNFREYKGDFRRVVNDTLQKLLGIGRTVTKKDLAWIYKENYADLIDNILSDLTKAKKTFFDFYEDNHVDPAVFIGRLFEKLVKKSAVSFELSKAFAKTEERVKNGGDDLIQLTYLLTAVEVYSNE